MELITKDMLLKECKEKPWKDDGIIFVTILPGDLQYQKLRIEDNYVNVYTSDPQENDIGELDFKSFLEHLYNGAFYFSTVEIEQTIEDAFDTINEDSPVISFIKGSAMEFYEMLQKCKQLPAGKYAFDMDLNTDFMDERACIRAFSRVLEIMKGGGTMEDLKNALY